MCGAQARIAGILLLLAAWIGNAVRSLEDGRTARFEKGLTVSSIVEFEKGWNTDVLPGRLEERDGFYRMSKAVWFLPK